MPTTPHDYADLFLAPVALQGDQRLQDLSGLDRDALHEKVVTESNNEAGNREDRARDLLRSLT